MATCGQISKGIGAPCAPAAAGLKTQLVLIPLAHIAGAVRNNLVKKAIVLNLVATKKGYLFEGINDSNAVRSKFVPGAYGGSYTHELDLVAFGISPEAIEQAENLARTRVVAVVPDNNGYFKVVGSNAGLRPSKLETDSANKDTGGSAVATLISEQEKGHPDFFMVFTAAPTPAYDYAATKTAFEALWTAADVITDPE